MPVGGLNEPSSNMLEQGSLTSVGLDKKTKKRRPMPAQQDPMMDPQNPLALMATQRPMLGTEPTEVDPEGMMKRKMTYG